MKGNEVLNKHRAAIRFQRRKAFTLMEMLVVIVIVGVMVSLLLPALNSAREASRGVTCQNNLRQFGIGIMEHSQRQGEFCSGAFDWRRDGAVTEIGWVADLVNAGIPVGQMLCPSNPGRISETYNDLLSMDVGSYSGCAELLGSEPKQALDGCLHVNPCRKIATASLAPGSEARREIVNDEIFEEHYNANYTASWFLVRSGLLLDDSGNPRPRQSGCGTSTTSLNTTMGPLTLANADSATPPASFIPFLGCGGVGSPLLQNIGENPSGTLTVKSMTAGPVGNPSMSPPNIPSGTPMAGAGGWYAMWTHHTLQDYRQFAPVHRHGCNLLFADGSVRSYFDENEDGFLNSGFDPTVNNGFTNDEDELPQNEVFSKWSLKVEKH